MDGWMDTPQTVMTTRAPAVLKTPLNTMGISYMALWGFGAKCWSGVDGVEWMDGWMDGYPLDCYDYQSTCGAKNAFTSNTNSHKSYIKSLKCCGQTAHSSVINAIH